MTKLALPELERHLWGAADVLRGGLDRLLGTDQDFRTLKPGGTR